MIPSTIRQKLARLRTRERLLDLVWGAALLVAIVLGLLLLAMLIDWAVDREVDTPAALRRFMIGTQIGVAAALAFFLVLWPLRKRLTDSALALRVEDRHRKLRHRLITAVELNQPHAATEGMSRELIDVVTREAVERTQPLDFAAVADKSRLWWGLLVLVPVLLLAALPFLVWHETLSVLLARQFGADQEIPRDVALVAVTKEVWPSGEKVTLEFAVKAPNLDELSGYAVVKPEQRSADRYPLEPDPNRPGVFVAELPSGSANFTYTARLGDGRTKSPARIRYVPRPVVIEQNAWVQLPEFVGKREDGSRYELPQSRGDIIGIAGSKARVAIKLQKPIQGGFLELLGPAKSDPDLSPEEQGPEVIKRSARLDKGNDDTWHGTFDIRPDETGYRVVVADEYGFTNVPPPRRSVRLVAEEPPQVALLKEQFPPKLKEFVSTGGTDDFIIEGLPLPVDGAIPIAYTASGAYGLGAAKFLYRVLKKVESGNDDPGDEKWHELPLQESLGSEAAGPFDPRIGAFARSEPKEQIFFHAIPDETPLPRTLGGGRFDFKTTGIPDGKGGLLKLKIGDQVEYCIEIYADKKGNKDRPWARSDTRVKTVVAFDELYRWLEDNFQEAQRIRQLDAKQRGLFDEK